ncbi:MAG: helix-turn-helix domain-containing protein [Sphaerochaeta sp.]|jgi:putative transcriptional regulator|uniref:helix-turn-helix domain-containing protein n=1 Tax=Sphaerochaeta sp. TaxID=1972642 RepID=UPI003D148524
MGLFRLDGVLADRKMSLTELSEKVGITMAHLSNLKTGKISAVRLATTEAICRHLSYQPGNLLEYAED